MTFGDFFDHLGDIAWVGVVVGTLALFVFGFLWYGPIFGKTWSKATGIPMNQEFSGMAGLMIATLVYLFIFNVGIAYLVPFDSVEHAVVWGFIVGVLLIGPALYARVVWGKRSTTELVLDVVHWYLAAGIAVYVQGLFV
jgi:hypothetical protein